MCVVRSRCPDPSFKILARELGVPFVGFWIDGSHDVLKARLRERVADASDATDDVLELQVRAGTGPLAWRRLDGSQSAEEVRKVACAVLAESEAAASVTAP